MRNPRPSPLFRHTPPELTPELLVRPRLIGILRRRFDERLLTVSAGPGFGKSILLAQAIEENKHERFGDDVWLGLGDDDHDPDHFLAGLYRSIAGRSTRRAVSPGDIAELVADRMPTPVALILDDVHSLGSPIGPAWRTMAHLVDQLPDNAHVVLSGRSLPPLRVGRGKRAEPEVTIDERSLAFDDHELAQCTGEEAPETLVLVPRWPALASFAGRLDHEASVAFVRSEVVATLHPERARLLALLAPFAVIDDAVVAAVAGTGAWTARRVFDGLPLVDQVGDQYEMHPLWSRALGDHVDAKDHDQALARGARLLLDRGEHVRAARAAQSAGDIGLVVEAVRSYCEQPLLNTTVDDIRSLQSFLPAGDATAGAELLLEAARIWTASERTAEEIFERAVERAKASGDREIEALARWRVAQLQYAHDHSGLVLDARIEQLAADGVGMAQATATFIRSVVAQRAGDPLEALREVGTFAALQSRLRRVTIAERLVDLGRPEQVSATIESVLAADDIDIFGAQALWLRGEVDPELAWPLAQQFPAMAKERNAAHEIVSVSGVVATIAIAAGEFDTARAIVQDARRFEACVGDHVVLMLDIAEAAVALCVDSEERAIEGLERSLERVPLGRWPSRAHLHGLTMLRALLPDEASVLDDCDLGPSFRTAVRAGAAIAAARAGSNAPARALDWSRPTLLRAHVPPPLLAELAAAASADTNEGAAREVLSDVPSVGRWLDRTAKRSRPRQAGAVAHLLAELPLDPGYVLQVRTLGGLAVSRSDGRELGPEWGRRRRVQDLFVYLLAHQRPTRKAAAAALWPSLSEAKAAANLRVNLTHLHAALEPGRQPGARPYFIDATSTDLRLIRDSIEIDTDQFDRHIAEASAAEADGVPTSALEHYAAASDLYRGWYLPLVEEEWVVPERLRLHSLAHAAICRTGELTLARGRPEQAIVSAVQAQQLDSMSERAHRLSIRCHLALGSESSARIAARGLIAQLHDDGLRPDIETQRLLSRLGVA